MARRKRKEDESDWVAPDFDEVQYMRTEIQAAHTAVITIAWAIVGAIVSFLLYSVNAGLAFFAGLAVGSGLYFILPLIGIDIRPFKRKDWVGNGITYFFSWLAFWILLLNPPFGDFTDPTIQGISVSPYRAGYTGDLTCVAVVSESVMIGLGSPNNSVFILFRASDNVGLSSLTVQVTPTGSVEPPFQVAPTYIGQGIQSQCAGHRGEFYPGGTYNVTFPWTYSAVVVAITARDTSGRGAAASFSIQV